MSHTTIDTGRRKARYLIYEEIACVMGGGMCMETGGIVNDLALVDGKEEDFAVVLEIAKAGHGRTCRQREEVSTTNWTHDCGRCQNRGGSAVLVYICLWNCWVPAQARA